MKVRGFRIELGEIETLLEQHPAVAKAVVATQPDEAGVQNLSAFWVQKGGTSTDSSALRAGLQQHLPAYMIPTRWMMLDSFPTTPNGKVDRKRLPQLTESVVQSEAEDESPMSAIETEIADIWRSVLKVEKLRADDDFFEVGGHSLAAMRVVGTIRSRYKIDLPVATFLRTPTIKAVAERIGTHA